MRYIKSGASGRCHTCEGHQLLAIPVPHQSYGLSTSVWCRPLVPSSSSAAELDHQDSGLRISTAGGERKSLSREPGEEAYYSPSASQTASPSGQPVMQPLRRHLIAEHTGRQLCFNQLCQTSCRTGCLLCQSLQQYSQAQVCCLPACRPAVPH